MLKCPVISHIDTRMAVQAKIPAIIGQEELTIPSSMGTNGITVVDGVVTLGPPVVVLVDPLPFPVNQVAIVPPPITGSNRI